MTDVFRIVELLHKYKQNILTEEEREELDLWLSERNHRELAGKWVSEEYERNVLSELDSYSAEEAYRRFAGRSFVRRFMDRWRLAAAVLIILMIIGVVWIRMNRVDRMDRLPVVRTVNTGSNRPVLTLADGQKVVLEKDTSVYLHDDYEVKIQADSVRLICKEGVKDAESLIYGELYVPRRGEYSLVLSDGSRVFLNADSHLKFPQTFGNAERRVELSGEAYFEVTGDSVRPFIVSVGGMEVKVLGTVFNVNAYRESEQVKTTLVSGKVEVGYKERSLELYPGEQACFHKLSGEILKDSVNVRLYTDWKDGLFKFERESLEQIMMVLERWYDVKVFFRSESLKAYRFSGDLKKYDTIEQHLKMLEMTTDISFSIHENNVFVGYK